jgi:hypothetical protein
MDRPILEKKPVWQYFSREQKDLIEEGLYLKDDIVRDNAFQFKDYSFLIFPFAKAYEGFLKQLFKDVKFISHLDYISDHLRLGKLLSPHLITKLGDRSLYLKIINAGGEPLARRIWQAWKIGRNEVFHYFPHNLRAVAYPDAEKIITEILLTMDEAFNQLKLPLP